MYEELEALEMEGLEDLELEYLGEEGLEDFEFDGFGEYEWEDWEGDPFLGRALKRLARTAARTVGGAIAGPTGANIANLIAGSVLREAEFEDLYEEEADFEDEFAEEGGDWELLAEMHHYADLAAEAESEAEADQFIDAIAKLAGPLLSSLLREDYEDYEALGFEDYEEFEGYEDYEADYFLPALVPLATSLLPKAVPLIARGARALGGFFSRLFRRRRRRRRRPRAHREAVRTMPDIVAETAVSLKRQAKLGRPMTKKKVAATMAKATAKKLSSPRKVAKAVQRNKKIARARTVRTTGRVLPARGRVLPPRRSRRLPV